MHGPLVMFNLVCMSGTASDWEKYCFRGSRAYNVVLEGVVHTVLF